MKLVSLIKGWLYRCFNPSCRRCGHREPRHFDEVHGVMICDSSECRGYHQA